MKRSICYLLLALLCSDIMLVADNSANGIRSVISSGSIRYVPTVHGSHRIDFDGRGCLKFDSARVNIGKVDQRLLKRGSRDEKPSIIGVPINIDRKQRNECDKASDRFFAMKSDVYHFEPEGLKFEAPATLTLPYYDAGSSEESKISIYHYDDGTKQWNRLEMISQDLVSKTVTVRIHHFSDYVVGTSSFKIDEAGTLEGGLSTKQDVDPYTGALLLRNTEFSIPARGLPISLCAGFNSDYLYWNVLNDPASGAPSADPEAAGRTLVKPPNGVYPLSCSTIWHGWSYGLPYCVLGPNTLTLSTAEGAVYKLIENVENDSGCYSASFSNKCVYYDRTSTTKIKILIPQERCSLLLSASQENQDDGDSYITISKCTIYFGDGTYGVFDSAGRLGVLYDASGKNSLTFSYSNAESLNVVSIKHSDGRYVKIFPYATSSTAEPSRFVYILSTNSSLTKIYSNDQFLALRTFSKNVCTSFCILGPGANPISNGTKWASLSFKQKEALFSILKKTEYSNSITSSVTGNTIKITEPGSGERTYTFGLSFYDGYTWCSVENDDGDDTMYLYHNKPKVLSVLSKENSSSASMAKTEYSYSCPRGTVFSSSSRYRTNTVSTKPSKAVLTYSTISSGVSQVEKRIETLEYKHEGADYAGVSSESTDYITSVGENKCFSKTVRTFSPKIYEKYYPATESCYFGDTQNKRYARSYSYDTYGREVYREVVDSANSATVYGKSYCYYLYSGTNKDCVFTSIPSSPSSKSIYTAFEVVLGSANRQSASATFVSYNIYDSLLNIATRRVLDSRNRAARTLDTSYMYNPTTNNLETITYPEGNTLTLSYDTNYGSFVAQDKQALGPNIGSADFLVHDYTYDLRGRMLSVTTSLKDESGNYLEGSAYPYRTDTYTYDECNRVLTKTRSGYNTAATTLYTRIYDDSTYLITTTDSLGYITKNKYNALYQLVSSKAYKPDGETLISDSAYTYHLAYPNNILTAKVFNDSSETTYYLTSYGYDPLGRLASVSKGNSSSPTIVSTTIYDDCTNSIDQRDYQAYPGAFSRTITARDWFGRTTSIKQYKDSSGSDPTPLETKYDYDYAGDLATKTLPNGEIYTYGYSYSGLLESIEYPNTTSSGTTRGTEIRTYDLNGRLAARTDVGGNRSAYIYNGADLMTVRTDSNTAESKTSITTTTTYTPYGPYKVTQQQGAITELIDQYEYDISGRVASDTRTIYSNGTSIGSMKVTHSYDSAGNLDSIGVQGLNGGYSRTLNYSDPCQGGATIASRSTLSTSVSTASGLVIGCASSLLCGAPDEIDYSVANISTQFINYDAYMRARKIDNPGIAYDYSYSYDLKGNVTVFEGASHGYDGLDRLADGGYGYDNISNMTDGNGNNFIYNTVIGSNTMHLKSMSGSAAISFMEDETLGNMTKDTTRFSTISYDARNLVSSIGDIGRIAGSTYTDTYGYDPSGLRYKKYEADSGETSYYLYEGNDILYKETWKSGARTKSEFNIYLAGVNIGRFSAPVGGTETLQYFYHDRLGSRRVVTDSSGTVQASIAYSTWGVPTVTNVASGYVGKNDISYTGKEYDATKLYYFNARYYDPKIGRFITEDPARSGINWYAYCNNNPLSFTDPTGLYLVMSVDKSQSTMTVYYTMPGQTEMRSYTLDVVVNVVAAGGKETSTTSSDTNRYQPSGSGTTNPTQVENGRYSISGTGVPSSSVAPSYKYGEGDNGLGINVTQMLPDVNTGELIPDGGYMIHITPNDFTNGCIGIQYDPNDAASKEAAEAVMGALVDLYNATMSDEGDKSAYIEYWD